MSLDRSMPTRIEEWRLSIPSSVGGIAVFDLHVIVGDPLLYHASHIVIASPPEAPIFLSRLSASLRIANSVRKALVLATTGTDDDHSVAYTSLYWMGFHTASGDVQPT